MYCFHTLSTACIVVKPKFLSVCSTKNRKFSNGISFPLTIPIGSFDVSSEFPFPRAPEITKANNASPITIIRNIDFSLILPNKATFMF